MSHSVFIPKVLSCRILNNSLKFIHLALPFNCRLLYLIKILVASVPEVPYKCYDSYIYEL